MEEADEQGYGSRSKYLYELIQEARAARQEGFLAYSQNESKVEELQLQVEQLEDELQNARNSEPGEIDIELDGVQVRMASAILLFVNPDRFTVLDWRAWDVLHENGYLPDEMPDDPTVEDYLLYLGACWAIANEYDVDLRTLDMALWALGGED